MGLPSFPEVFTTKIVTGLFLLDHCPGILKFACKVFPDDTSPKLWPGIVHGIVWTWTNTLKGMCLRTPLSTTYS